MVTDFEKTRTDQRELIKYCLRIKGSSLAKISRELGISLSTVSQVCSGSRKSKRVQSAIALKLNISVAVLQNEARLKEALNEYLS